MAKSIRVGDVRPNIPVDEMSSYELILKLQDEGWSWMFLSARARALSHDLRATPRELVWYSGMSVQRGYLRCLLQGPSLLGRYGIECIPHHAKPATYQDLLRGVAPQPEVAPIEDAEFQAWLPDDRPRGVAVGPSSVPQCGPDTEEQPADDASAMANEGDVAADILVDDDLFNEMFEGGGDEEADEEVDPGPASEDHPPPKPAEAARRAAMAGRSFRWGCFLFTRKAGAFQATCPWHKKSIATGCKKTLSIGRGTEEDCIRRLKFWCVQARKWRLQREHVFMQDISAAPTDEMLEIMLVEGDLWEESGPALGSVLTDNYIIAQDIMSPSRVGSQGQSRATSSSTRNVAPKRSAKVAAKGSVDKDRGRARAVVVAQSSVEGVAVQACDNSGSDSSSGSSSSSSSSASSCVSSSSSATS